MSRLSREQKRELAPAECPQPGSGILPVDVRVPASGDGASVGGMPVTALPGEPLQTTVLDYLHRLAVATGHPVLATVHDERIGYAVPLQMSVDGSTCFVDEPVRVDELVRETPAAAPAAAAVPAPAAAAAPAPAPTLALALGAHAVVPVTEDDDAPKPPPVREFEIAEAVMGAVDADGAAPSPFAEPIGRINEAVRAGRIDEAAELAELTTAQASATYGPEHPEVLWLRELAAYIAYLAGDLLGSCRLSLDLARLRHDQRDPRAVYGNVQSAAAAWRAVRDPHQGLHLGRELIDLWTELTAETGPAADDIEQLESARTRMGRLADRARTNPAPGTVIWPAPGPAIGTDV